MSNARLRFSVNFSAKRTPSVREPFWLVQPPPKSCPRLRGKWTRANASGRKGCGSEVVCAFCCSPSDNPPNGILPAPPHAVEPFWLVQPPPKSCPRVRGKWTRANASGRKGCGSEVVCAFCCSPSDNPPNGVLPAPPQAVEPIGLPQSNLRFASPPCYAGPLWLEQGRLTHCRS